MDNTSKVELTIFIDGQCPLCVIEMGHLTRKDTQTKLKIVDIFSNDINLHYPELDTNMAMNALHGLTSDGEWLIGLDVTHRAWTLVGCGWRTSFLRWRWLKPITDKAYYFFAKHRNFISKLLTGKSRLKDCDQCSFYRLKNTPGDE